MQVVVAGRADLEAAGAPGPRRSRAAPPSSACRASQPYLLSRARDLPARRFELLPLGRVRQMRGIRIVDVDEELAPDPEVGQRRDRAALARTSTMCPIRWPVFCPSPARDDLVVASRACRRRTPPTRRAAARRVRRVTAPQAVRTKMPAPSAVRMCRPSVSPASSVAPLSSRYQAGLPGTSKASTTSPEGRPSCSAGAKGLPSADRQARHGCPVEHVEDAVLIESPQHARMRPDAEGRALAQRQQSRDRVDLAVRKDDAGDRRVSAAGRLSDAAAASP